MTDNNNDFDYREVNGEKKSGEGNNDFLKKNPSLGFIIRLSLSLLIVACIIAAVFITNSGKEGIFSEFYILGKDGKAADYPISVGIDNEIQLTMGIMNHEGSRQAYSVDITIGDTFIDSIGPITLEHNQKWEQIVAFKPVSKGEGQKVEFVLTRQFQHAREINKPLILHMTLNVQ